MVEIIALLMFVGAEQKLIEMTYMPSVKVCLEKRRISTRNSNATFMCSKVMAELSEDNKILKIEKLK